MMYINKIISLSKMENFFDQEFNFQLDYPHPQTKILCPTSDIDGYLPLKFIHDDQVNQSNEQNINFFSQVMPYEEDEDSLIKIVGRLNQPITDIIPSPKSHTNKKPKKNSNAIKKMGRIILTQLKEYELKGMVNTGVINMMEKLEQRCSNKKAKCFVDGFNTYHLEALFDVKEEDISRFNLKTTRRIFTKMMRRDVLESFQIKGQGKLLYLNTLKCSALRFMSKRLANRLQNSDIPQ